VKRDLERNEENWLPATNCPLFMWAWTRRRRRRSRIWSCSCSTIQYASTL